MTDVAVDCHTTDAGWSCRVTIGRDPGATVHEVTVSDDVLEALAPEASDPDALVEASFRFLLAREPRESILPSFDLTVIGRYFPEWEAEIRKGTVR